MNARIVALMLAGAVLGCAGDSALDRATLRGLKGVNVVIDPLDAALEQDGLSANALKNRIEDRLTKAGIAVNRDAREFLALKLTSVRARRMPVAILVSLALYQPVVLARDDKIRTATGTWSAETVLMSQGKVVVGATNSSVDETVDQFIRAYQSINAK